MKFVIYIPVEEEETDKLGVVARFGRQTKKPAHCIILRTEDVVFELYFVPTNRTVRCLGLSRSFC